MVPSVLLVVIILMVPSVLLVVIILMVPGKNLWVSFSGVVGIILFTLFQQSYKGFKGKFFRVCCTAHDLTLLDGFPLYWVREFKLKTPKTLEELSP